jgi:hypothetical protein
VGYKSFDLEEPGGVEDWPGKTCQGDWLGVKGGQKKKEVLVGIMGKVEGVLRAIIKGPITSWCQSVLK